jgi:energy-coupling factor transporter ATP-binding protein EcfA2
LPPASPPVERDVTFTVSKGECVALVGESGSGKTTVARTIAGLHRRPSSGRPRNRAIDEALLAATRRQLADHGYAALSLSASGCRGADDAPGDLPSLANESRTR